MKNKDIQKMLGLLFIYISCIFVLPDKVDAYTPPIGIPKPDFGIEDSHMMYTGQRFDFDGDDVLEEGEEYRDAGNGPYTHYIDNSIACTDVDNIYGTAANPRCSCPLSISAGSVIELHGGPYPYLIISEAHGTPSNPIFVRGYSISDKIIINDVNDNHAVAINNSSYVIIENIITDGSALTGASRSAGVVIKSPADHIAIRHSEATGYPIPDPNSDGEALWNAAVWSTGAGTDGASGSRTSHIVFYDNYIHNNADATWPPPYETGRHGTMVASGAEYVWILNSKIFRSGDDGVQIYYKETGNYGPPAHHVYIGDNEVYEMGENAFDVKQSYDVVISKNKVHNFTATTQLGAGSDGAAIVLNNDEPSDRLWVLFNEVYDSNIGIRSQSHGSVFIAGNLIHDIIRPFGSDVPLSGLQVGTAITCSASPNLNIVNNTLYNIDGGIYIVYVTGAVYDVSNNIVANLNELTSYAIYFNTLLFDVYNNLLYSSNGNTTFKKTTCNACVVGSDPLFVNVSNNDFHIASGSAAIGGGFGSDVYDDFYARYGVRIDVDFDGNPRPASGPWTLGAFEYQARFRADVDNSGGITTTDALLTLRNSLGLSMTGTAWQASATTGDVNCDNTSNSADSLLILRYSLGLDNSETAWCEGS